MATTLGTIGTFRYGNPAHDCDGALIRAHSRRLATVVSVSGELSARNLARVASRVGRFVIEESDFILDLGGLESVDAECRSLIHVVDDGCRAAGVDWALVASDEVIDVLNLDDDEVSCSGARSVPEALRSFADANTARRRALLPLLGKIA
jgi:ABC-type transporter Mla MlaB component